MLLTYKCQWHFKSLSVNYTAVIRFQTGKNGNIFFEDLESSATVSLSVKGSLFPVKFWFVAGICLIWKLKEYARDHKPNALAVRMF